MPNLLDIRRRIKSVKNTQQITKAMKMVSAAKLKRAQDRVVTARPFANKMMEVLGELAGRTDEDFHHPLLDARGDERYLLVLVTADKGLVRRVQYESDQSRASFHSRAFRISRLRFWLSDARAEIFSVAEVRRWPANTLGLLVKAE